jgi:hypothetical protein
MVFVRQVAFFLAGLALPRHPGFLHFAGPLAQTPTRSTIINPATKARTYRFSL